MAKAELARIDSFQLENSVEVRHCVHFRSKILTIILMIIIILVTIIVSTLLFLRSKSPSTTEQIITMTMKTETSSTTIANAPFICILLDVCQPASGLSLNHSLYYNVHSLASHDEHIHYAKFRLFTNWTGNKPLYIFTISPASDPWRIISRYSIIPKLNNTQWQTIEIPFERIKVAKGHMAGIGMQDRTDTNQISTVNGSFSFYAENIVHNTTDIFSNNRKQKPGIAFVYNTWESQEIN